MSSLGFWGLRVWGDGRDHREKDMGCLGFWGGGGGVGVCLLFLNQCDMFRLGTPNPAQTPNRLSCAL